MLWVIIIIILFVQIYFPDCKLGENCTLPLSPLISQLCVKMYPWSSNTVCDYYVVHGNISTHALPTKKKYKIRLKSRHSNIEAP